MADGYASRSSALVDAQAARDDLRPGVLVTSRHALHSTEPPTDPALPLWATPTSPRERLVRPVRRWAVDRRALADAIVTAGRQHRADAVHVHWSSTIGAAAADAAESLGLPLVAEVRFDLAGAVVAQSVRRDLPWLEDLLRRRFEGHLQRAAAIVAASDTLAELVAALGATAPIAVIRNGVDGDTFAPGPGDPSRFGPSGRRPVVGAVSNLLRYEGFDRLLGALPDGADGLLVGGGPELDALQAAVANLGHDRWHLPGPVPTADAPDAWRSLDVVVLPRRATTVTRHASPLKLAEAMAAGRAVVASAVGDVPALLADGRGVLVPPDDDRALAAAVAALVADPERRSALGTAARHHVLATCSWSVAAEQAAELYEELSGSR